MQSITRTLTRQTRLFRIPQATSTTRPLSSTFISRKSATETVKETVHQVDKAVSSKIVDGIEVGQTATQKVKTAAGLSASEAKTAAANAASEAQGAAQGAKSSTTGSASGTASEISGKASELAGQAKGKAAEVKGAAKGKANEVKGKL